MNFRNWFIAAAVAIGFLTPAAIYGNSLDLLLRAEKGVALTATDADNNYIAIENAVHALGTMSVQNQTAVNISGGTIAGTTITGYQPSIAANGVLKGASGIISAAVANTDYQSPVTATGVLKGGGGGSISAAAVGTDYQAPVTATGILKGAGAGSVVAGTAGTDYYAPGGTDVALGDGGSGASTAAGARTNYGLGNRVVAQNCNAVPPQATPATYNTLSGTSTPAETFEVWDFVDAASRFLDWQCTLNSVLPAGSGMELKLCMTSTVANNGILMDAAVRRMDASKDLDTTAFTYTGQTATLTMSATVGSPTCGTISFTSAQIDSAVANDMINVRVWRDGAGGADTNTGTAKLFAQSFFLREP